MGESLERVQFKFASIIGELCSEPDVLSQFAVWLDLRLAEYKLKGNISLECSGEEPDPIWLKGLKKGHIRGGVMQADKRLRNHSGVNAQQTDKPLTNNIVYSPQTLSNCRTGFSSFVDITSRDNAESRPLSNTVTVLDEPADVKPEILKRDCEFTIDDRLVRKRSYQGSSHPSFNASEYSQIHPTLSQSKHRKLSSPLEFSSNQNPSSVFNEYHRSSQETIAKGDNPDSTPTCTNRSSSSTLYRTSSENDRTDDPIDPAVSIDNSQYLDSEEKIFCLEKSGINSVESKIRRNRLGNVEHVPKKSVTNMVGAVGCFERWLWESNHGDQRPITEIPPNVLDGYLSKFFTQIKTGNGLEYKPNSFRGFRTYLDRYLKLVEYPESIMTSEIFFQSRETFSQKLQQLKQKEIFTLSFLSV